MSTTTILDKLERLNIFDQEAPLAKLGFSKDVIEGLLQKKLSAALQQENVVADKLLQKDELLLSSINSGEQAGKIEADLPHPIADWVAAAQNFSLKDEKEFNKSLEASDKDFKVLSDKYEALKAAYTTFQNSQEHSDNASKQQQKSITNFLVQQLETINTLEDKAEKERKKLALLKLLMYYDSLSLVHRLQESPLDYTNAKTIVVSEREEEGKKYTLTLKVVPLLDARKLANKIDAKEDGVVHDISTRRFVALIHLRKEKDTLIDLCKKVENPSHWKDVSALKEDLEEATLTLSASLDVWQKAVPGFPTNAEEKQCLEALKKGVAALREIKMVANLRTIAEKRHARMKDKKNAPADEEAQLKVLMKEVQGEVAKKMEKRLETLENDPENVEEFQVLQTALAQQKRLKKPIALHYDSEALKNAFNQQDNPEYWLKGSDLDAIIEGSGFLERYKEAFTLYSHTNEADLRETLEKDISKDTPILCIYNTGNHWVTFAIIDDNGTKTVLYKDPSGGAIDPELEAILTSQNIGIKKENVQVHENNEQGEDNDHCGIMALENMAIMAQNLNAEDKEQRENFIGNFADTKVTEFCTLEEAKRYRTHEYPKHYLEGRRTVEEYQAIFSAEDPSEWLHKFVEQFCEELYLEENPTLKNQLVTLLTSKFEAMLSDEEDKALVKAIIPEAVTAYLVEEGVATARQKTKKKAVPEIKKASPESENVKHPAKPKPTVDHHIRQNAFNQMNNGKNWYQGTDLKMMAESGELRIDFVICDSLTIGIDETTKKQELNLKILLEENKNQEQTLYAYNKGGNHWVTFAIVNDGDTKTVLYKDSLGGGVDEILKKALEAQGVEDKDIHIHTGEEQRGNRYNCGPMMLENMKIIAQGLAQEPEKREAFIRGFEDTVFCKLEAAEGLRKSHARLYGKGAIKIQNNDEWNWKEASKEPEVLKVVINNLCKAINLAHNPTDIDRLKVECCNLIKEACSTYNPDANVDRQVINEAIDAYLKENGITTTTKKKKALVKV